MNEGFETVDADRQIRFLVSPVLFIAPLFWGAWFDHGQKIVNLAEQLIAGHNSLGDLVAKVAVGLAAGGLLVFAAGYVIGSIGYFTLRAAYYLCSRAFGTLHQFHEARLSENTLKRLGTRQNLPKPISRSFELSAVVALDHGHIRQHHQGIHLWMVRRWNAFSIAANSICGIVLSFLLGSWLGISIVWRWYVPVGGFAIALIFVAVWAWCDTMRMLTFMVTLHPGRDEIAT